MPATPNTVPTVITDVNGKITTVYKRRDAATGKASSIPMPSLCSRTISPDDMVDEIVDIYNSLVPTEHMPVLRLDKARLGELDDFSEDEPEYLAKLYSFIKEVNAHEGAYLNLYHLTYSGIKFSDEQMRIITNYTDIVTKYPESVLPIIELHRILTIIHKVEPDADGRISTMEAHLKARINYGKIYGHAGRPPINRSERSYETNGTYMMTVHKYADHIDELLKYREERNVAIEKAKDVNFSEADFAEYLKHYAPLAEGWL